MRVRCAPKAVGSLMMLAATACSLQTINETHGSGWRLISRRDTSAEIGSASVGTRGGNQLLRLVIGGGGNPDKCAHPGIMQLDRQGSSVRVEFNWESRICVGGAN